MSQSYPESEGYARIMPVGSQQQKYRELIKDLSRPGRNGEPLSKAVTKAQIVEAANDPTKLCLLVEYARPGMKLFITALEYEVFPPGTPLNDAYELYTDFWGERAWIVLLVPMAARPEVEKVATQSGVHIYDGVPHTCQTPDRIMICGNTRKGQPGYNQMMERGEVTVYPIHGDNAFAIEPNGQQPPFAPGEEAALVNFIVAEWEAKYNPR